MSVMWCHFQLIVVPGQPMTMMPMPVGVPPPGPMMMVPPGNPPMMGQPMPLMGAIPQATLPVGTQPFAISAHTGL